MKRGSSWRWTIFLLFSTLVCWAQGIPISGTARPRFAPFDELVLRIMKEHGAMAGMLAIRSNGQVVYERDFGWLDEGKSKPTPPDAMCRIASLTKPITAAAVQMLIKQGK